MANRAIGVSGAQGGGKTSLLNELKNRGYHVDDFRVSRAVQKQLGWDSLDRVMDSPETMMAFQEEVFNQKYQNDFAFRNQDSLFTLTERTFADIASYTTTWTWKFVDQGAMTLERAMAFLSPFVAKCTRAQGEVYSGVIILPLMSHVVWEEDPHRAKRSDVNAVFETLERFMDRRDFLAFPKLNVTARSIVERADQVETFLTGLK